MRLLDGGVGDLGLEGVVEGLFLLQGEDVFVEDVAELFEALGFGLVLFAELFRGENG